MAAGPPAQALGAAEALTTLGEGKGGRGGIVQGEGDQDESTKKSSGE